MPLRKGKSGRTKSTPAGVLLLVVSLLAAAFLSAVIYIGVYRPQRLYKEAEDMVLNGDYNDAIEEFISITGWRDSAQRITDCYAELFHLYLWQGDLEKAFSVYDRVISTDEDSRELMLHDIYLYALKMKDGSRSETAVELFAGILKGYLDSDTLYNRYRYEEGIGKLNEGDLTQAYDIFITVDPSLIHEVTGKIELCRQITYDRAVEEFYDLNMVNGMPGRDIVLPDIFLEPMLDNYLETENYRRYVALSGMWEPKDRRKNIEIVYEMGSFLNVKENGFAMQRLYERRYVNDWGISFFINADGEAETNIPRYFLAGYYGLYSKIENGIYYIGSDEVRWTKQFAFRFDDMDNTLYVYSYAVGREFHLHRDKNPVYA